MYSYMLKICVYMFMRVCVLGVHVCKYMYVYQKDHITGTIRSYMFIYQNLCTYVYTCV